MSVSVSDAAGQWKPRNCPASFRRRSSSLNVIVPTCGNNLNIYSITGTLLAKTKCELADPYNATINVCDNCAISHQEKCWSIRAGAANALETMLQRIL